MLTMAPQTRPCSALNVELSTLNSSMLVSGGSDFQGAEGQIVGCHAIDQKTDRLFAIACRIEGECADAANGFSTDTPVGDGATDPGTSRPRSVKCRPLSGICCTFYSSVTTCPTVAGCHDRREALRRGRSPFRLFVANGQVEVAHQCPSDVDDQRFDALGAKPGGCRSDRIRPVWEPP